MKFCTDKQKINICFTWNGASKACLEISIDFMKHKITLVSKTQTFSLHTLTKQPLDLPPRAESLRLDNLKT